MATVLIGAGLALVLALLAAIYRKLDSIPPRVWAIAKRERAQDEAKALTALQEATTAKVGTITAALRTYETHIAREYQELVAVAETRARVAERRAEDVGAALSAAVDLVRELRGLLDGLGRLPNAEGQPGGEPDIDARRTRRLGAPPPASDDDEAEEELTTVAPRPLAVIEATSSGLRLAPRTAAPAGAEGQR